MISRSEISKIAAGLTVACMVAGGTAAISSYNSEIYADDSDAIEIVFGPEDGESADPGDTDGSDDGSDPGDTDGSDDSSDPGDADGSDDGSDAGDADESDDRSKSGDADGSDDGSDAGDADESDDRSKSGGAEGSEDGGKMSSDSASGKSSDNSSSGKNSDNSTSGKSSKKKTGRLVDHVKGIRDFSLIEGMVPDPMAGISWDETIGTVLCDTTKIDWGEVGTHDLTYTIAAMDQTIEFETIKVTVYENLEFYIYGMEGEEKVAVGGSYDPMADISYDDKISSVTADTSELDLSKVGEYAVTYTLTDTDGREQTAVRRVYVTSSGADEWDNSDNAGNYSVVVDLGVWRLTAYMDTPEDQGPYVGQTASGAPLVAGRTVAVSAATCSRVGLHFGDKLLIDGHVYTLEDHGGSAMNNQDWVDIFVNHPGDEYSERFNRYSHVYLLR